MTEVIDIFHVTDISELPTFPERTEQLALVERQAPQGVEAFFQTMMREPFSVAGKVRKEHAETEISHYLKDTIPEELQSDPFYDRWIGDMADVCRVFCDMQQSDSICFWLGSERGCRRYHTDNVALRAIVTYAGKGTEYLPDHAADRKAFAAGAPNEQIIKDPSSVCFMDAWDVAVFRGGNDGLLHRTPDAALNGPSIMMRLDRASFWDRVLSRSI